MPGCFAYPSSLPRPQLQLALSLKTLILTALCLLAFLPTADAQNKPIEVRLATQGKANMPVTTSATATPRTLAAAQNLANYLGMIAGGNFKAEIGDGKTGVVVGVAGDFENLPFTVDFDKKDPTQREDYFLRSTKDALYLIGATEAAVEHAVWDVLFRLGHRQFFPNPTWEVVPNNPDIKIAVDVKEHPDYLVRRIWYGFGTWPENRPGQNDWNTRNRATGGMVLNTGHAYDAIHDANKKAFAEHPEYLALVKGERKGRKFCISNPGLRQLVVDYAISRFKAAPDADSISMDPTDGGGWCECAECAKMGSPTDRAITLANTVAEAIQQFGPKYVGIYAYNEHSPPPSIRVHPMVIVSVATAFITGGYSVDELIAGWQKQGSRMLGIREYYSVMAWDRDMPTARASNPNYMKTSLPKFYDKGARFMSAESSDNWGPNGLGYYVASRIMWDIKEADRVDEIIADFIDKSFGPARVPMAEYYKLLAPDAGRPITDDWMGRLWRSLDKARKLTTDPAINARLDHLVLYTHFMDLYRTYTDAKGEARQAAFEALIRHSYRIRRTNMVHNLGMYRDLVGRDKAMVIPPEAKFSVAELDKAGKPLNPWKSSAPFTPEELATMLQTGIEKNQTVDIKPVQFSGDLVPAAKLRLTSGARGNIALLRGVQNIFTWNTLGQAPIGLRVTGGHIYNNRGNATFTLHAGPGFDSAALQTEVVAPDKTEHAITLTPKTNGLHRIRLTEGSAGTTVDWDATVPITFESSLPRRPVFNGRWSLYFYVPKGTKSIGGFSSGDGVLRDSANTVVHKFVDKAGYFDIPVADGQDGKLWKMENTSGQRALMTVPPYFARSADELLLPKEVVEADAPR